MSGQDSNRKRTKSLFGKPKLLLQSKNSNCSFETIIELNINTTRGVKTVQRKLNQVEVWVCFFLNIFIFYIFFSISVTKSIFEYFVF